MSDYIDITPEQLVETLVDACATYTDDVKQKVHKGIDKIAREAKSEVKKKSPRSKKKYDGNPENYKGSGRFAKENSKPYNESWITRKEENNGVYTVTVHNKRFQLVHLLELGHVLRDGTGRVYGEVTPREHVKPVNTDAEKKVDKLLEEL